jgi:hypothetical protein
MLVVVWVMCCAVLVCGYTIWVRYVSRLLLHVLDLQ